MFSAREEEIYRQAVHGIPGPEGVTMPISTKKEIIWREAEDEVLIVNTATGFYFSLNGTATEIWRQLCNGAEPQQIAGKLSTEYTIAESEALRDIDELMGALRAEGIVE